MRARAGTNRAARPHEALTKPSLSVHSLFISHRSLSINSLNDCVDPDASRLHRMVLDASTAAPRVLCIYPWDGNSMAKHCNGNFGDGHSCIPGELAFAPHAVLTQCSSRGATPHCPTYSPM